MTCERERERLSQSKHGREFLPDVGDGVETTIAQALRRHPTNREETATTATVIIRFVDITSETEI